MAESKDELKEKELFIKVGKKLAELGNMIVLLSSKNDSSAETRRELESILQEAIKNIAATLQTLKISNFASGLIRNFEGMISSLRPDIEALQKKGEDVLAKFMSIVKPNDLGDDRMNDTKATIIINAYNEFRAKGINEAEAMKMAFNYFKAVRDKN